ncbi:unnamed protein product [Zymoseptoria tritici ST99CH_3D7]|uniref:Zn(2)-C6 fungal-type domain-containing protein n=1 Tax=Zymoseptoria tritici (strain ST99CH_3D7) TaxID=1276538 RepID=A0A1X7RSV9_ZYMT9|nr:unnamed protein product [Zymoseptoria tritici ST99CH_3D7]
MSNDASTAASSQPRTSVSSSNHLRQKRARSQLSCIPCRTGKLKCNRAHDPACDQCIKRNRESACAWAAPAVKQKGVRNVNGRIKQLESLVVDLMNKQQGGGHSQEEERESSTEHTTGQPTPPSSDETESQEQNEFDAPTKPFGELRIGKNGISYVGTSHWHAILNGISDLKRELEDDDEEEEEELQAEQTQYTRPFGIEPLDQSFGYTNTLRTPGKASTGMGFMLGNPESKTREQLIAAVPEKRVTDRLLSLWFNSPDPFKNIVHGPTFQDEYKHFCKDPKQTPTMWLGLLFSIISLAASFGLRDGDPTTDAARKTLAEVNEYHGLAASAATLAEFASPKRYTIECLILYAAGLRSSNAMVNVWLMVGLIIRLTLRMGYHRDADNYPAVSVFEGEMRRRCWASINMIDVLISFQLGLPSMVRTIVTDTKPPSNLLDRDFNVSTAVLPPCRSIDELTPCSYVRSKLKLTAVLAEAAELSHSTIPPSHEQTMDLDRRLDEAKAAIPPLLQMPDISELVTDPAEQLMCRFNLDLLYLKTRIVLHRRWMETPFCELTAPEQARGLGLSRQKAVDSALRVLQHHHTIYAATQVGGQLESVKWYMGSISTHDFLLAAMVICLELSQHIGSRAERMNKPGTRCPFRGSMIEELEKSQRIWAETSRARRGAGGKNSKGMFDETGKASRAMAVMLRKINALPVEGEDVPVVPAVPGSTADVEQTTRGDLPSVVNGMPSGGVYGDLSMGAHWTSLPPDFDLQAQSALYSDPSSGTTFNSYTNPKTGSGISSDLPFDLDPSLSPDDFAMINDMLSMPNTIDWDMFDQGVISAAGIQGSDQTTGTLDGMQNVGDGDAMMDFWPAAGNAIVGNGTGPGSGVLQGGWDVFPELGFGEF